MASKEEVRGWMETLACGQGFYGRMIENLDNDPEKWDKLTEAVNANGIKDVVSFCMFIES